LEAGSAVLYLLATGRLARSARPWPRRRTAAFLGGLACVAVALQSPLARRDNHLGWHIAGHLILMSAAAPLLCVGGPALLAVRSLSARGRRVVVNALRDPAMAVLDRPLAGVALTLEYAASMWVYLGTGWYAASQGDTFAHASTHLYFLICGVSFWVPVTGAGLGRWRPSLGVRTAMAGCAVAGNLGLALVLALRWRPDGQNPGGGAGVLALLGGGLTAGGVLLARSSYRSVTSSRRRPHEPPVDHRSRQHHRLTATETETEQSAHPTQERADQVGGEHAAGHVRVLPPAARGRPSDRRGRPRRGRGPRGQLPRRG
jgi:hypothetical protein